MDLSTFAALGGVVALIAMLVTKWFSGRKTARRLKKIESIINCADATLPPEKMVEAIKIRLTVWREDDNADSK